MSIESKSFRILKFIEGDFQKYKNTKFDTNVLVYHRLYDLEMYLNNMSKKKIREIIRVNQAGELGAIQIYKGQLAVLKNKPIANDLKDMLSKEKKHYDKFNELLNSYEVRPTIFSPIWKTGAFGLGVLTAILGKKATHACTEAVEEVIIDHYQKQTQYLKGKDNNLAKITKKFCKEEKEHLDFASEHDTGSDLFHSTLKKGIKLLSKSAIKISEKA